MSNPSILIKKATIHIAGIPGMSIGGEPVEFLNLNGIAPAAREEPISSSWLIAAANSWLNPDMDRFTSEPGSGIIYDPLTGLTWSPDELEATDWDASARACRDYRLGGFTDWRMPTDRELLTIVDRERCNPCLLSIFKTKGEAVWTSTPTPWTKDKAGSARSFFFVAMDYGYVDNSYAGYRLRGRPVRRGVPASQ